jgi:hypothetical protein
VSGPSGELEAAAGVGLSAAARGPLTFLPAQTTPLKTAAEFEQSVLPGKKLLHLPQRKAPDREPEFGGLSHFRQRHQFRKGAKRTQLDTGAD